MRKTLITTLVLASLLAPSLSMSAPAKDSEVLTTVNGVQVRKAEIVERLWSRHSNAALAERVDEILVKQAADAMKVAPDAAETDARLKRAVAQFGDEAALTRQLAATGATMDTLRTQLSDQVVRERLVAKAKSIEVTDAEVKEFFDANKDRLGVPEAARVRHILMSAESDAKAFATALKNGADFGRLAGQVSLDQATKDKGGDLGFISKGMLQPEIEKVVFSLKPGEVSEPVKTPIGFSLLKVEELRPAKPAVFDEIKADLRGALLSDKIGKAWPAYLQELRGKAKVETPVKR